MDIDRSHVLLDACCILNIFASGRGLDILKAWPVQMVVTQVVRDNELTTLQSLDGDNNEAGEQFELAISQGLLWWILILK